MNFATFSERNAVEISQGKETGKSENLETTIEFQKENVSLEVVKCDADNSFIEMTLNIADEEMFFASISGDDSVFMEYDDGYIFFPKMSIKGYFFSKETIENYKMITDDYFNYGKFAEYLKNEFPKNHIKPDDIIISK